MADSTDLERTVNTPGRAELVKEVREKIDALGVTYKIGRAHV